MKDIRKPFLSIALVLVTLFTLSSPAFALMHQPEEDQLSENHVVFSGLSQLNCGDSIQYEIETDTGSAVIGITRENGLQRAGGETWRVWYKGLNCSAEFYMTVSNNKVTSVYDYSISVFGGSYEDPVLTKSTSYGKLTFTLKSLGGFSAATCWLKGTVTGSDDEIDVTWQM